MKAKFNFERQEEILQYKKLKEGIMNERKELVRAMEVVEQSKLLILNENAKRKEEEKNRIAEIKSIGEVVSTKLEEVKKIILLDRDEIVSIREIDSAKINLLIDQMNKVELQVNKKIVVAVIEKIVEEKDKIVNEEENELELLIEGNLNEVRIISPEEPPRKKAKGKFSDDPANNYL